MYSVVLWNGYSGKLELFRGSTENLHLLAEAHAKDGDKVIYFEAVIDSVILREV